MILLVDNYDSFVYNLRRYLVRLGQEVWVVRNDQVRLGELDAGAVEAVVLSPGPQSPDEAGICLELVRKFHDRLPMLGVCLGHQVIWQALGGQIAQARQPTHGRTSQVRWEASPIFENIENPFWAARYHSLAAVAQTVPPELKMTAWSDDGEIMACEHRQFPVFGWQFHPESILTHCGYQLLANFLRLAHVQHPPLNLPPSDLEIRSLGTEAATPFEKGEDHVPFAVLPGSPWLP